MADVATSETVPAAPCVSVLVTCYNLGRYIEESVDSVLSQTYQDFGGILIIDDGSTDVETHDVLKDFKRPKTTLFRTGNRGLAAARNFLIGHARGKYVCALDADDRLRPRFLEETVAVLDRDPSVTFVSTRLQMFGDEERVWPDSNQCDLPTLLAEDTVITAALTRRSAVLAVGGYDERMPAQGDEDWDLWISLVEQGYSGVILPEILFDYRRRRGSMCNLCTSGQTHLDLTEYLIRKHRASYRRHTIDVLLAKDAQIGALLAANRRIESELAVYLGPGLARLQAELITLRRKLSQIQSDTESDVAPSSKESPGSELSAMALEYRRSRDEVAALRASASWKATRPLRIAYEILNRLWGPRVR